MAATKVMSASVKRVGKKVTATVKGRKVAGRRKTGTATAASIGTALKKAEADLRKKSAKKAGKRKSTKKRKTAKRKSPKRKSAKRRTTKRRTTKRRSRR